MATVVFQTYRAENVTLITGDSSNIPKIPRVNEYSSTSIGLK